MHIWKRPRSVIGAIEGHLTWGPVVFKYPRSHAQYVNPMDIRYSQGLCIPVAVLDSIKSSMCQQHLKNEHSNLVLTPLSPRKQTKWTCMVHWMKWHPPKICFVSNFIPLKILKYYFTSTFCYIIVNLGSDLSLKKEYELKAELKTCLCSKTGH